MTTVLILINMGILIGVIILLLILDYKDMEIIEIEEDDYINEQ